MTNMYFFFMKFKILSVIFSLEVPNPDPNFKSSIFQLIKKNNRPIRVLIYFLDLFVKIK